jgi:hypothetical protein
VTEHIYGVSLAVFDDRHPSVARLRRTFEYDHLPEPLQQVSAIFAKAAVEILHRVPDSPDLVVALRNLWESKNLVVMSVARPEG